MTTRTALSEDEIAIILTAVSNISRRDAVALEDQQRLLPPLHESFWEVVNSYGSLEFSPPRKADLRDAELVPFEDGRGYAVDIDLPVKDAREGEFGAVVITFEILRNQTPSVVAIQGAYW
jgi:hypothetical protein